MNLPDTEHLHPLFSIDPTPYLVRNTTNEPIIYREVTLQPGCFCDLPQIDYDETYDLWNLNVYDTNGIRLKGDNQEGDNEAYDWSFFTKITRIDLIYYIEKFINYHFDKTHHKHDFIKHIEYYVLPLFMAGDKAYSDIIDIIIKWIAEKKAELEAAPALTAGSKSPEAKGKKEPNKRKVESDEEKQKTLWDKWQGSPEAKSMLIDFLKQPHSKYLVSKEPAPFVKVDNESNLVWNIKNHSWTQYLRGLISALVSAGFVSQASSGRSWSAILKNTFRLNNVENDIFVDLKEAKGQRRYFMPFDDLPQKLTAPTSPKAEG